MNLKHWKDIFGQIIFQNGQKTHEKMFNIISHEGNASQNHNEILPLTNQNV